jgi:hypothetical protein
MAQAKQARRITLEGPEEGDPMQSKRGVYELEAGKEATARGVWMATGKEEFLYYAISNEWCITDRESMDVGKAAGWMFVASTALTPDKITEGWHAYDGGAIVAAPKVKARVFTAEEARAEAERLEQERQRAMAQAKQGNCPKGHTLQQFQAEHGGYYCDLCGRGIPVGSTLPYCRTCDFGVCSACVCSTGMVRQVATLSCTTPAAPTSGS